MAEAVAFPAASTDRLEQVGFVSLCAMAGALQFSIAAAQILLTLSAIIWLVLVATGRVRFGAPRFFWPLLAYGALTLVSAAFSPDPRASLIDCKQLVLFAIVPLCLAMVPRSRAGALLTVVLTFAAASATVGILQYGVLHYDNLGQRPQGTLGHYMTYSGLLMLVICVALARVLFGGRDRLWAALVMPALAVAVALTFTRSASVGVLAAAAALFALKDFRLFAVVPIVAAFFIAVAPGPISQRLASSFNMSDETVRDRIAMLNIGKRMIIAHPLTGVGPKMVQERYAEYRGPDAVKDINPHLHNVPVQIAAERGIPALAVWLVFVGMLVVDLWAVFRAADATRRGVVATALAAVVATLAAGMFEYNFGDSEFLMLLLILIALPFTVPRTAHA